MRILFLLLVIVSCSNTPTVPPQPQPEHAPPQPGLQPQPQVYPQPTPTAPGGGPLIPPEASKASDYRDSVVALVKSSLDTCATESNNLSHCISQLSDQQTCGVILDPHEQIMCLAILAQVKNPNNLLYIKDFGLHQAIQYLFENPSVEFALYQAASILYECTTPDARSIDHQCVEHKLRTTEGNLLPPNENNPSQALGSPSTHHSILDRIMATLSHNNYASYFNWLKQYRDMHSVTPSTSIIYIQLAKALVRGWKPGQIGGYGDRFAIAPPPAPSGTPPSSGTCHLKPGVCDYHHRSVENERWKAGGYAAIRSKDCENEAVNGTKICRWGADTWWEQITSVGGGQCKLRNEVKEKDPCLVASADKCGKGVFEKCQLE